MVQQLIKIKFSENLKALRQEKQLTQAQMADKCGVGRNTLINLESGDNSPTLVKVMEICNTFDIGFNELVFGVEDMDDLKVVINNKRYVMKQFLRTLQDEAILPLTWIAFVSFQFGIWSMPL
jgi:transcriptional regulator with XRE-family HTH domain